MAVMMTVMTPKKKNSNKRKTKEKKVEKNKRQVGQKTIKI